MAKNNNEDGEKPQTKKDKLDQRFEITSLTRMDLTNELVGFSRDRAISVTDEQMCEIGNKMSVTYVQELYFQSLRYIAQMVVDEK